MLLSERWIGRFLAVTLQRKQNNAVAILSIVFHAVTQIGIKICPAEEALGAKTETAQTIVVKQNKLSVMFCLKFL